MYEDEGYRFCPECGALMKNGKCMNCGYEEGVAQENGVNESDAPGFPENAAEGTQRQPEQNEHPKEGAFGQPENPFHEEQRPRNQGGSQPYTGQPPHAGAYYGQPDGQPNGGQGYGNQPGGGQPFYNQGYSGQPGNGQPPYHAPYNGQPYGNQGYGNQTYGNPVQGGPPYGYPPYGGGPYNGPAGYGQQGYAYGWEESRKDNKILAAVIIAVVAVLVCIVMLLLFFIVRGSVSASFNQVGNYEEFQDPNGGYYGDGNSLPYEGQEPPAGQMEPEEEYVPSADDDYYVRLANAVRDDLSYSIEWEEYSYEDEETGATAVGRYPRIVGGNIPNLDELNASIEQEATYYSNLYGYYRDWQPDDLRYATESIGYVTYMDEEKLSIVLQEEFAADGQVNISLYSINVDLVSGEIMNNGEVIDYNQQLAEEFRDQNDYQNGYVEAVDALSDEELIDFLSDENTNIVFYTPVGLEIGFNYTTTDSSGWVTATIKDYERYIHKF